jgi:hypothetical protein
MLWPWDQKEKLLQVSESAETDRAQDRFKMSVIRKQFGLVAMIVAATFARSLPAQPFPDTKPLTVEGDVAGQMVAGIDKYLMRELAETPERRKAAWKWDYMAQTASTPTKNAYRKKLRTILGVVDQRVPNVEIEYVATTEQASLVAKTSKYEVHAVRWPVFAGVDAEGLLLEPKLQNGHKPAALVVALPDADWTPEMFIGLAPGVPDSKQFPRLLAENGCRVLVPTLIDRRDIGRAMCDCEGTNQPHRGIHLPDVIRIGAAHHWI